jgi:hypothetical protein
MRSIASQALPVIHPAVNRAQPLALMSAKPAPQGRQALKSSRRSALLTVTSQPSVAFKPNLLAFGYTERYITYTP